MRALLCRCSPRHAAHGSTWMLARIARQDHNAAVSTPSRAHRPPLVRFVPWSLVLLASAPACTDDYEVETRHELPSQVALSADSERLDFGEVALGGAAVIRTICVSASGPEDIQIASIDIEGPFAHDGTVQLLKAGQSLCLRVWPLATSSGPVHGLLAMRTTDARGNLDVPLSGHVVCEPYTEPVFQKSTLMGASPSQPTSLQFGPDGRLYVAQLNGVIQMYTVQRLGPNQYQVQSTETVDLVARIPNFNDDGSPNPDLQGRLVTGLFVTGSAANPEILVTSSDPRVVHGIDSGLDTNSGVISRLRHVGGQWTRKDLVRGLPRSEELHVTNGMALDEASQMLYVCQGGHTNQGAPSQTLGLLPEYALSAAILSVDLLAIGAQTYDLPTLDDEDRPEDPDGNDPMGGNNGKNQARLVPGGPVQVHSPGWRNPFDVVITKSGRMYAFDNGPNAGWGASALSCSNAPNDASTPVFGDQLHLVPGPGFYAGHPNPTRANQSNTFNASNPQSPVAQDNPIECNWLQPGLPIGQGGDGAFAVLPFSCDGIVEYDAPNFKNALRGQLLVGCLDRKVRRVRLAADGASVLEVAPLFSNVAFAPVDVTMQPEGAYLAGTVWVVDYTANQLVVLEPIDFDQPCGAPCPGVKSWELDDDGDKFKNADEYANGTNPCSAGDFPPDYDGDFLSDLSDPDDDGDGVSDLVDLFPLDTLNGFGLSPPFAYSWHLGDPGFGLLGLGFTGIMSDGLTDYLEQYNPTKMTVGGAAGVLTIEDERFGTSLGAINKQYAGFHIGFRPLLNQGSYHVESRLLAPYFNGAPPTPSQSMGLFVGTGSQSDFFRVVLAPGGGTGKIEVGLEIQDQYNSKSYNVDWLSSDFVDLRIGYSPDSRRLEARCSVDGAPFISLGPALQLPEGTLLEQALRGVQGLAAGVHATSLGGEQFTATWDGISVQLGSP